MNSIDEDSIIPIIRSEARKYVDEYFINPNHEDFCIIFNAMLKSADIVLQKESKEISISVSKLRNENLYN